MAIGDKALARGLRLTPGTALAKDIDDEINRVLDYLAELTSTLLGIEGGGTGATSAAGARNNLDVPSKREAVGNASAASNAITLGWNGTTFRLVMRVDGTNVGEIANSNDLTTINNGIAGMDSRITSANDNANSRVAKSGDTMSGQLYLPNSAAATSGFTVAYINSDGRVSRGSSARKYKKFISDVDPLELGDIFPQLVKYQIRTGDGDWKLGHIADDLEGDAARFAVFVNDEVESIDFIQMLLAQTAQLNARVAALETRIGER